MTHLVRVVNVLERVLCQDFLETTNRRFGLVDDVGPALFFSVSRVVHARFGAFGLKSASKMNGAYQTQNSSHLFLHVLQKSFIVVGVVFFGFAQPGGTAVFVLFRIPLQIELHQPLRLGDL